MAWRSPALRILLSCWLGLFFSFPGEFRQKKPPEKPVNINTASPEELQTVPGIGPATAEKILYIRKSIGAIKSVGDVLAIRELGPKRLEKMRKYLTVGKAPPGKTVQPSTKPAPSQEKPRDKE